MTTQSEITDDERRAFRAAVVDAVGPLLAQMDARAAGPRAVDALRKAFPLDGEPMQSLKALLARGRETGALGEKESGGVRFSRVKKAADDADFSIDYVHMQGPGPGHVHPRGEIDLCFAVSGSPLFDGQAPGFTAYGKETWHVPTVSGGAMDILYFLPGGSITFGPDPKAM
jgi:hypothetical protein